MADPVTTAVNVAASTGLSNAVAQGMTHAIMGVVAQTLVYHGLPALLFWVVWKELDSEYRESWDEYLMELHAAYVSPLIDQFKRFLKDRWINRTASEKPTTAK